MVRYSCGDERYGFPKSRTVSPGARVSDLRSFVERQYLQCFPPANFEGFSLLSDVPLERVIESGPGSGLAQVEPCGSF